MGMKIPANIPSSRIPERHNAIDHDATKGVEQGEKANKKKRGKKAGGDEDEAELQALGLSPDGTPLLKEGGDVGAAFQNPVQAAESAYEAAAEARDKGIAAKRVLGG